METALNSGPDREEPACDVASSMEIAPPAPVLQGFSRRSLQGSFQDGAMRAPLPGTHHPIKSARAKAGRWENLLKTAPRRQTCAGGAGSVIVRRRCRTA